jgi:hypothetical protein
MIIRTLIAVRQLKWPELLAPLCIFLLDDLPTKWSQKSGYLSRYSDQLRTGRPGFDYWLCKTFSSPQRPDRIWGPPSLLSVGYRWLFPWGKSGWGVNLITHLHLVPRSRKLELYLHSQICLHGIVLNSLSTRRALLADHSGRAVQGLSRLLSLYHWDHVFESHSRHGSLCAFILCWCCYA